ncbi:MAG: ATP-binding protein, partial [Treponema sp.]|nr:ATP-binding protein [Treponema sp.]
MVQKVISITGFRIEEKKLQFALYLDPAIPKILVGDEQRIIQVITNLLTNAVKFTPEQGSIWLNAYHEKEEDGICTIKLEVKDTGIGIAPEHHDRLFSSFEQAESSTSRKFGGTGLGLAICKHIVELMSGYIWIESDLGRGAVFALTIQLRRGAGRNGEADDSLQEVSLREAQMKRFKGHRLLLAEDMEINREIVISLLEPLEIEIEC